MQEARERMQDVREKLEESPQISQFQEKVKEMAQAKPLRKVMEAQEELPLSVYYAGIIGSVALSLGLFLTGRKWASLFVGLWAPTIVGTALMPYFIKMFKPSEKPSE